jgi:hypothetical protein
MPAWQDFQEEILYPVHPFSLCADHGPCTYRKARPGAESGAVVLCPGGVATEHFRAWAQKMLRSSPWRRLGWICRGESGEVDKRAATTLLPTKRMEHPRCVIAADPNGERAHYPSSTAVGTRGPRSPNGGDPCVGTADYSGQADVSARHPWRSWQFVRREQP